jgi:membrane protein implicated in regulation of membrane protease activity
MALTVAIILALFVPWLWKLVAVLAGLGIEAVELTWGLPLARRWRPQTGAEAMIGQLAEVVAPCHPTGQVRVQGELWEARCADGADVDRPCASRDSKARPSSWFPQVARPHLNSSLKTRN